MSSKTTKTLCVAGIICLVMALSASVCSASGVPQWTANGVALSSIAGSVAWYPTITSDGSGGAIVTWYDNRSGSGEDIYAQRVNSSGLPKWTANGVALRSIATSAASSPTITSDGSGGAIVTWFDNRSGSGDDIYAQRVNASGLPQWTANGVALRSIAGSAAWYPTITSDGSGGAIVTWRDNRSGSNDIYAQRVNASGLPQWTANGVALRSIAGSTASSPTMTSDGSGGAIVTWYDNRSGSTDIYAQRVNASGLPQWTANGVALRSIAGSSALYPTITSDGSGGAIVTWRDNRSGDYDIYAQRVNASGLPQWTANGVALRSIAGSDASSPTVTSDGSGGAIATWHDNRSGSTDIYVRRVNSSGVPQWTANGVALRSIAGSSAQGPTITPCGPGGAIVTWVDFRRSGSNDIYAQRVNASGLPQWTANGVALRSIAGSNADSPTITSDGSGGAVVTWFDHRSGDWNVYTQRITTTYSITVTQGAHGTITPSGSAAIVTVKESASQTFNITPAANYHVATLAVDGARVALAQTYKFSNVTSDHTIAATFAEDTTPTWYLAEGTSDYGFDTYINIENPNSSAVTALVTYMTKSGPRTKAAMVLPAMSQTVINPRDDIGSTDFSTKVQCKEGKNICVDRRMIWQGPGAPSQEGHASVGVTAPAKTWYLAEGSCKWGFESWLLIQNPGNSVAHCTVTYMIEGVGPKPVHHDVPANSRASFNMLTDLEGVPGDASIKVASDVPVIPERSMYRNNRREGHNSIGTTSPSNDYYLAEGTTDWGFTTYCLVQNPNGKPANINITYMTPNGPVKQAPFTMDANSRKTICVNDIVPKKDLSIHVNGSLPIIAERAMYWGAGTALGEACHDSIGMSSPHKTFYLPDGETYNGKETWTLIQNPNSTEAKVTLLYLSADGTPPKVLSKSIPANSRKTYSMMDDIGPARAAICVKGNVPIMVERAMYWNNRGAGTDTIGGYGD